jgi:hypothetical protein
VAAGHPHVVSYFINGLPGLGIFLHSSTSLLPLITDHWLLIT